MYEAQRNLQNRIVELDHCDVIDKNTEQLSGAIPETKIIFIAVLSNMVMRQGEYVSVEIILHHPHQSEG